MRVVVATTNITSTFNTSNLKQLAKFTIIPVYTMFVRDLQIGWAKYPRVEEDSLTVEISLNDKEVDQYIAAFSVGYVVEGDNYGVGYNKVHIKCIGTVSDARIHD